MEDFSRQIRSLRKIVEEGQQREGMTKIVFFFIFNLLTFRSVTPTTIPSSNV